MEKTYVMIKPEFADELVVIEVIKERIIKAGLKIKEQSYVKFDAAHTRKLYSKHLGKDFYPALEKYITSDVAYGMIVEGENAVSKLQSIAGTTNNPAPGTIRHDVPIALGNRQGSTKNVVHVSDSTESAEKEIAIFKDLENGYTK